MSKAEGEPEGSRFSMARLRGGFHAWQERREKERIKRDAETYELLNSGRSFDPERHEDQDPLDSAQSNNGSPAYRTRMP